MINNAPDRALSVWLKFDPEWDDELAAYEANVYREGNSYRVDWCHNGVGLVQSREFDTHKQAQDWLESEGFQDFTVEG